MLTEDTTTAGSATGMVISEEDLRQVICDGLDIDPNAIEIPIIKRNHRKWKVLESKGDNVTIKDPKLKQGYLGILEDKSIIELQDVLRRQDAILNNKGWWSKLHDKGERLRLRRQEVANALEKTKEREKALSSAELPPDIYDIEWRGTQGKRQQLTTTKPVNCELDSDDEEALNPLELMAYHASLTKKPKGKNKGFDERDPSDIIAEELEQLDLQDAEESARRGSEEEKGQIEERSENFKLEGSVKDFGVERIKSVELRKLRNGEVREPFKPFRRCANPKPIPGLQTIIDQHRPKEARPVKMISLQESISLEREYLAKSRTKELKKTAEMLGKKKNVHKIGLPPSASTLKYRDENLTKHLLDCDDEDEFCYLPKYSDEEDEEEYFEEE